MIGRKIILTSRDSRMYKIYTWFEFWHSTPLGMFIGILESSEIKLYNLEDWSVRFEEW